MSRLKRDDNRIPTLSLAKNTVNSGLISAGSIAFAAGDNATTEKKTSAISMVSGTDMVHPDDIYALAIEKPADASAGDLTIYVYNQVKIDGTNERDVLLVTLTVDDISGANTYRMFILQGLFIGEATIKIGAKFAADSGALTVYYKLFNI